MCACLHCLHSFESSYYHSQRDIITYTVIVIVIASIVYFSAVFFAEAFGVCQPKCGPSKKPTGKKSHRQPRSKLKEFEMMNPTRRKSIAQFHVRGGLVVR